MSEAKNFRYYRILINEQPGPSLASVQFPTAELFFKMCNRNLYMQGSLCGRHICAPLRSTNNAYCKAARNNANIWFQYRHKFDQLFIANEQIIPLNTFINTFTIQRA